MNKKCSSSGGRDWERFLSFNLKIVLIVMAALTLYRQEYSWFIGTLAALLLVFMPAILESDFNVKLPIIFDLAITMSISLHVIGGYLDFYTTIPFYDHFTHFLSSATISFIAVTLLYVLTFNLKIIKLPPIGFGILTVFFAMSMGVVWEFIEWGTDMAMNTDFQRGLQDTMWDLFFDTIAGTIVGALATARLKTGCPPINETVLEVGDVRGSIGYKRWREMRKFDSKIPSNIVKSFRDPMIMDSVIDYIVEESKYLSEAQRKYWKSTKKEKED
jgi:uncharacterized membrane protein YjdF